MITKSTGYQSSDKQFHASLEDAQKHQIKLLLAEAEMGCANDVVSEAIWLKRDEIVDVLTTKTNSLPKARKINGGRKKRTPKHIAEQHTLPLDQPKDAA